MILVDANVLLYAYDGSSPHHQAALRFWESCLSEPRPVRLAWQTVVAFLRIGTNPRALRSPMGLDEACHHVGTWLERPMVDLLEPTPRHWRIFERLLRRSQAVANLVSDAHLAALAIEHGATLCSTDRDFSRFEGLTWQDPLAREGQQKS
ncbi:MAG: type II toxin-antitoxin system VapC family toxin [Acidobacteriota bacterium]